MSTSPSPKSSGTTLLLNFLIPGAGHVYASNGERWGYLAANIVCAVSGACIYLPWIGNVVIWIITMSASSEVTQEYNGRDAQRLFDEENLRAEEKRRAEHERTDQARTAALARAGEEEAEAAARATTARRVSGAALAQRLAKLDVLRKTGVMSQEEVGREFAAAVASASTGWTDEGFADFLSPFAELAQAGVVSVEQLRTIKGLFHALPKGPPKA